MSDDMLLHFSSNSSNQSDQSLPTKMAKLEARMVGKTSSIPPPAQSQSTRTSISSAVKFVATESLMEPSTSSDSDDGTGDGFLIQANTQKRQKLQDANDSTLPERAEAFQAVEEGRQNVVETVETKKNVDVNRKKQARGRGQSLSNRGRGSRVNDQMKSQISLSTIPPTNGQHDSLYLKDGMCKEQLRVDNRSPMEEELVSLRAKVASLEEDLRKSRQESSEYQNLYRELEKELKEIKEYEQQMKPKVCLPQGINPFSCKLKNL